MFLINAPIEPIENRYSAQWDRWVNCYLGGLVGDFQQNSGSKYENFSFKTVYGDKPDSSTVNSGLFLDPSATSIWKASQLANIFKVMKSEVAKGRRCFSIFFHDLWHPGVEQLRYFSLMTGISVEIYGIFHAGTWDPHDLTATNGLTPYFRTSELTWTSCATKIFVATEFHKELILSALEINKLEEKIKVVGLPFYKNDVAQSGSASLSIKDFRSKNERNPNWIAFPHRSAKEKGTDDLRNVIGALKNYNPNLEVKVTHNLTTNKQEYYDLLSSCEYSLSLAKQETFGISMAESVFCGCLPLVPDALAYKELYSSIFKYDQSSIVSNILNLFKWFSEDDLKNYSKEILLLNDKKLTDIGESCLNKIFFEVLGD